MTSVNQAIISNDSFVNSFNASTRQHSVINIAISWVDHLDWIRHIDWASCLVDFRSRLRRIDLKKFWKDIRECVTQ